MTLKFNPSNWQRPHAVHSSLIFPLWVRRIYFSSSTSIGINTPMTPVQRTAKVRGWWMKSRSRDCCRESRIPTCGWSSAKSARKRPRPSRSCANSSLISLPMNPCKLRVWWAPFGGSGVDSVVMVIVKTDLLQLLWRLSYAGFVHYTEGGMLKTF